MEKHNLDQVLAGLRNELKRRRDHVDWLKGELVQAEKDVEQFQKTIAETIGIEIAPPEEQTGAALEDLQGYVAMKSGGRGQSRTTMATTKLNGHVHRVVLDHLGDGHTTAANGHTHKVCKFVMTIASGHVHGLVIPAEEAR